MPRTHVIQPGECTDSVAVAHGLLPDAVWQHRDNAELRRRRGDPNILAPGDRLVLPEPRLKAVECPVDARHRFVRKGVPTKFRLQVHDAAGEPRARIGFVIERPGARVAGETDDDGVLEIWLPSDARAGTLELAGDPTRYRLHFGALRPLPPADELPEAGASLRGDEMLGARQRLHNLGFLRDVDERDPAVLRFALDHFQHRFGLEDTGLLDAATRDALEQLHDRRGDLPPYVHDHDEGDAAPPPRSAPASAPAASAAALAGPEAFLGDDDYEGDLDDDDLRVARPR